MAEMTFDDLLESCTSGAAHLEMRDAYSLFDPIFLDWQSGRESDPLIHEREWFDLASRTVSRGVLLRRLRLVSEPVSEWIRHEFETTPKLNLRAGEKVRWLPRHQAVGLAFPANDFWIFDDRAVRFSYFAGDGEYVGDEVFTDPGTVTFCRNAFEAAWTRGLDHDEYRPIQRSR